LKEHRIFLQSSIHAGCLGPLARSDDAGQNLVSSIRAKWVIKEVVLEYQLPSEPGEDVET